jgi:broad specificity phosphatase PhoE
VPSRSRSGGKEVVRLVLVRHGHAGRKDQWRRADKLRPLDARGRRQADRLVATLSRQRPTRIVSSGYVRCVQTMAPLSEARGVKVECTSRLAPDAPASALRLIRQLAKPGSRSGVVVCTHGEVIGDVLVHLAKEDGVKLARRPPGLKGCVWILDFRDGKLLRSQYRPPA